MLGRSADAPALVELYAVRLNVSCRENDHEMKDIPIEDPNQKALLNQMIIASHLVRQLAEKDAYLNSLKEQRAEALAEIVWLKQQISELAGDQTGSVA
jgi:hypothetical protein